MNSSKQNLQIKAIELRRSGKSYSEILDAVPVAKSTLSLWLRDVGLAKHIQMRLTQKRLDASRRGGDARKQEKIDRVKKILSLSESQITPLSQKELWLMGIMLYWAEGSKEKDSKPGSGVSFSNSDPRMLKLFLSWLKGACQVTGDRIYYEIYLHESHRDSLKEVQKFWHDKLLVGNSHQVPVYFKKNKIKTLRKNIGSNYKGLIRIKVKKSSELQRQITGWINGVCKNSGVV